MTKTLNLLSQQLKFRCYVDNRPQIRGSEVYLFAKNMAGDDHILELKMGPRRLLGSFPEPTVVVAESGGLLQSLADALWDAGVRPSGAKYTSEALEMQNRHLEDMRAIVFKKLGIGKL